MSIVVSRCLFRNTEIIFFWKSATRSKSTFCVRISQKNLGIWKTKNFRVLWPWSWLTDPSSFIDTRNSRHNCSFCFAHRLFEKCVKSFRGILLFVYLACPRMELYNPFTRYCIIAQLFVVPRIPYFILYQDKTWCNIQYCKFRICKNWLRYNPILELRAW